MSTVIDKVAWVHIVDGKILCVLSQGKDAYYLPGGKREDGETDIQVLTREIAEELTAVIRPDTVSYFGTFQDQAHGKTHGTLVKMTCYQAEYEGELQPAAEIEAMSWLSYRDRDRVSPAVQIIFDRLKELCLLV